MSGIVLIGQGPTGATALESLIHHHEVAAVCRNVNRADDPVAAVAMRYSVPLVQETSLASVAELVSAVRPACVVISSYDRIIGPDLLRVCPFVNVHYSPLPGYRGRANVNWAVINKEVETAITIHLVDPHLDSGNILFQEAVPIGPKSSVTELYEWLNEIQRRELGPAVRRFLDGDNGHPQTGTPSYCCTRVSDDGEIDWRAPTGDIYALIRALTKPYPGAYTFFALQRIRILRAEPLAGAPRYVGRIPGRVCGVDNGNGAVDVLTGDGVLRIYEIEGLDGEGKAAASVIRSTKATLGLNARDLLGQLALAQKTIASMESRLERKADGVCP